MKKTPRSLKIWFIIHFLIDIIFGLPLLFIPKLTLTFLGFTTIETLTARLLGAALIGIGGTSFLIKDKKLEQFKALLLLKIVWSSAAILAILLTLYQGAPKITWLILIVFVIFSAVWYYYNKTLK